MDLTKKTNIEQAIRVAQANKKELFTKKLDEELNDAARFIVAFDIKEGKNKIISSIVYEAYETWAERPLSKISFMKMFADMFMKHKGQFKNYYLLNYKPAELLKEAQKLKKQE